MDEIYSTRGMIPGDKFDATTFNINGWTFDPDEAEDASKDQLREMLKKAKEDMSLSDSTLRVTFLATANL